MTPLSDHRDSQPWSSDEAERFWRKLLDLETELASVRAVIPSQAPQSIELSNPSGWRLKARLGWYTLALAAIVAGTLIAKYWLT